MQPKIANNEIAEPYDREVHINVLVAEFNTFLKPYNVRILTDIIETENTFLYSINLMNTFRTKFLKCRD